MKIKITYTVCGMDFVVIESDISEAYEYLRAIVEKEYDGIRPKEVLSDCMVSLVKMKNRGLYKHGNNIFKIEAIQEETQK